MRFFPSRTQDLLILAVLPVAAAASGAAAQTPGIPLESLGQIENITRTTVLPLDSPPINGFVPQVVFGLSSEQDTQGTYLFSAVPSYTGTGVPLIPSASAHYSIATFDTGSDSHVIRYDELAPFDFAGEQLYGANEQEITGASGTETCDISDALGVYVTGFGNATSTAGTLSLDPSALVGQWNIPILSTRSSPQSALPNIIGSPMIAQHEAVIRNSLTRRINYNGTVYRSPEVDFEPLDTPETSDYVRFSNTDVLSGNGVAADPAYLPNVLGNNWANDPLSPGFWANLYTNVTVGRSGSGTTDQFLFDTGAEVSVISKATANALGIKTGGSSPTPPDFYVDIAGVGGSTTHVPGFYLSSLSVLTSGGTVSWTNVPVIMLDLTDPRDFTGTLPGILGMNLFTDRDLIVNGGLSDPFVAFSEVPFTAKWNKGASGNWGEDTAWILGVPDAVDAPANFLTSSAPETINVDANYTVGSIHFDSSNSYTLSDSGRLTLQTSAGPASIHVSTGSHAITAAVTVASDTAIAVDPSAATLTMGSLTNNGYTLTKSGPGTLTITGAQSNASGSSFYANGGTTNFQTDAGSAASAHLTVNVGANLTFNATQHLAALNVSSNGRAKVTAGGSKVLYTGTLSIAGTGALDLADHDLVVNNGSFSTIESYVLAGYRDLPDSSASGIVSSTAQANGGLTILALFDNSLAGATDWPLGSGNSIPSNAIIGRYTYFGDSNLDGMVTGDDYGAVDANLGQTVAAGLSWLYGDMNFDGVVTGDDYASIDANLGLGVGNPLVGQSVPEPAGFAAILMAAAGGIRRRRKSPLY